MRRLGQVRFSSTTGIHGRYFSNGIFFGVTDGGGMARLYAAKFGIVQNDRCPCFPERRIKVVCDGSGAVDAIAQTRSR
jgi:hypothetical protein